MVLDLKTIDAGFPGITPTRAAGMHEAAAVCLEHNSHAPGVAISIAGDVSANETLQWQLPTDHSRLTWADLQEATEQGAYGLAALLVQSFTSLTVVERSRKGTGFDYWLGPKSNPTPLFQDKQRLEVSGILASSGQMVNQRLKVKIDQVTGVPSPLNAVVIVVDFGEPHGRLKYL